MQLVIGPSSVYCHNIVIVRLLKHLITVTTSINCVPRIFHIHVTLSQRQVCLLLFRNVVKRK